MSEIRYNFYKSTHGGSNEVQTNIDKPVAEPDTAINSTSMAILNNSSIVPEIEQVDPKKLSNTKIELNLGNFNQTLPSGKKFNLDLIFWKAIFGGA